jgi:predicted O-methyltransferase YrrM
LPSACVGVTLNHWRIHTRGRAYVLRRPRLCERGLVNGGNAHERGAAIGQVRSVIERLLHDGTAVARLDGRIHRLFPAAVSAAEGEALEKWVLREGATRTIEIGLGYGISALFVCKGLLANGYAGARHVIIDPYQTTRFAKCGLQFLDEAGLADLVEHQEEESQIVLPRFLGEGRRFDLAFVDGNHRFDGVFLDVVYLGRLVRAGGIVFVDDYQLAAVKRAVSFFLTKLNWTLEEVSPEDDLHQWAVLRTLAVPDTRRFDYYVVF